MSSSAFSTDEPPAKKRAIEDDGDSYAGDDETLPEAAAAAAAAEPPPVKPSLESMKESPAHEFFGDKFFYSGKEVFAKMLAPQRKEAFGTEKTAEEILYGAKSFEELSDILCKPNINSSLVKPYWEHAISKPEDILDGAHYVLTGEDYVDKMHYIPGATNYEIRHGGTDDDARRIRSHNIHIVLGSSGSGKTAFAWKHLANPRRMKSSVDGNNDQRWVSFYHQAGPEFSLTRTIDQIKGKIAQVTGGKYDAKTYGPLEMNLALVIDEAALLEGKLDSLDLLREAVSSLKSTLVTGDVRLIVAGTGYDTMVDDISSQVDVFKYDMKPWLQDNINEYIRKSGSFDRKEGSVLISCMQKYLILSKLASNARLATILLTRQNLCDFEFLENKNEPGVVGRLIVVCALSYSKLNGLAKLGEFERRLVARAVLGQLDSSLQKKECVVAPSFDQLSLPEGFGSTVINVSRSLVEHNYERSIKGGRKLIDDSLPAIFVSPAITVVLFIFLGTSPTALAGWQLLEMIGALTLLKKAATRPIEDWTEVNIKEDFQRLRLDNLLTAMPAPRAESRLRIPCNIRSCIWINGPMAPFGDYFSATDKVIGQAKYVGSDIAKVKINLFDECLKTGLLRSEVAIKEPKTKAKYFLRLALLDALSTQAASYHVTVSEQTKKQLQSCATILVPEDHAYPQALLLRKERDPVEVLDCQVDHDRGKLSIGSGPFIDVDGKDASKDWEFHFITNGKSFELALSRDVLVSIKRSNVDFHGEVKTDTKTEALEKWRKANLWEGVVLRFFFAVKHEQ